MKRWRDRKEPIGLDQRIEFALAQRLDEIPSASRWPWKLALACLLDAVISINRYDGGKGWGQAARENLSAFEDAREWMDPNGYTGLFSFEHCCDLLGISDAFVRRELGIRVRAAMRHRGAA